MSEHTIGNGHTLRNTLGASTPEALGNLGEGFVAARLIEIRFDLGTKGDFDAAHFRTVHHHLFQDVFEWSGHTRDDRIFEITTSEEDEPSHPAPT